MVKGLTRRQAAKRVERSLATIDSLVRVGALTPDHRGRIALNDLAVVFPEIATTTAQEGQADEQG
ncbi:MAG TPA: hypothetical protein VMF32_25360 [Xanthobacteraceae bacterium]|nr:hypothetical protein [Xanthobacteraceae bacterium]